MEGKPSVGRMGKEGAGTAAEAEDKIVAVIAGPVVGIVAGKLETAVEVAPGTIEANTILGVVRSPGTTDVGGITPMRTKPQGRENE